MSFLQYIIAGGVFWLFLLTGVMVCGVGHGARLGTVLKETFLPLRRREFWFPPCPLCWLMRVATVALGMSCALWI